MDLHLHIRKSKFLCQLIIKQSGAMLFGTDNIVNLVLLLFSFLQLVLGINLIMTVTHII